MDAGHLPARAVAVNLNRPDDQLLAATSLLCTERPSRLAVLEILRCPNLGSTNRIRSYPLRNLTRCMH